MTKQSAPSGSKSKSSRLTLAVLGVVLAAVAFGAAFYLLDGANLASGAWSSVMAMLGMGQDEPVATRPPIKDPNALALPDGMPEDFALRLWQEQVESQANIEYLVEGDVKAIDVRNTAIAGDESISRITVTFSDGTTMPGELGMRRLGGAWYASWVRGDRGAAAALVSETDDGHLLPAKSEIDTALLSEAITSQKASAAVLNEYASGKIKRIDVTGVTQDAGTSEVALAITQADGATWEGTLKAVQADASPEPVWILAGFERLGAK